MPDAAYYRRWRAAHPAYRTREAARSAASRLINGRGNRRHEYHNRNEQRHHDQPTEALPPLFPDLARGTTLEFWDEALAADLRQEAALAELEGRDPRKAVLAYRYRERRWLMITTSANALLR